MALVVKDLPANIGDARDVGKIPTQMEEEMTAHSNVLAWRIPWTCSGLQSLGLQSQTQVTEPIRPGKASGELRCSGFWLVSLALPGPKRLPSP